MTKLTSPAIRSFINAASLKGLLGISIFLFLILPVAKYIALHSNVMDLGLFECHVISVAGGEWQAALSGHLQGYSILLSPLIFNISGNVVPVGVALVLFQASILVLPAVALFRVAGVWFALAYMAYAPVWINAHFDFHFDHLAVPFMMGFYLNLKNERPWLACLFAGLLTIIKEPFALVAAGCGLMMILRAIDSEKFLLTDKVSQVKKCSVISHSEKHWFFTGSLIFLIGLGYFYFGTRYLLPYFAPVKWSVFATSSAFSWLGSNVIEIINSIVTQPLGIVREIVTTPGKLVYLFVVFGLLAFIPLLAPAYLIPAIPLLAISMLSRLPNYYDYNTHYTAGLIVPVFFSFMYGLPKAYAIWIKFAKFIFYKTSSLLKAQIRFDYLNTGFLFYVLVAAWILAGHVMLSPSPISRLFWSDKVWAYGWRAYVQSERDVIIKAAMLEHIPEDPLVSVSSQNSINWHYLARRKIYVPFPMGIEEPIKSMDWSSRDWGSFWSYVYNGEMPSVISHDRHADFVVLDMKRPYFLVDKGCDWIYGRCNNKINEELFLNAVSMTRASYETVFVHDGFMILRRRQQ